MTKAEREQKARQAVFDGIAELKKRIDDYASIAGNFYEVLPALNEFKSFLGCIEEGLYFDPDPWDVIG